MKLAMIVLLAFVSMPLHAADTPLEFADAAQEARFRRLLTELRCLVCQNQSLEDSHAPLAQDLRDEAYALVRQGASDAQVVQFMVARYGDFVRFRPAVKPATLLLWFGPVLLLIAAAAVAWRHLRRQAVQPLVALSAEETRRATQLLAGESRHGGEAAR